MKASYADQILLVDVAELDARIARAERARANPPQAARVQELMARRGELSHELSSRLGARDDLRAELARIESDVAVVDARRARDTDRLAASSNVKEAQGLESELLSLNKRKGDLEDAELELMEKLEQADAAVVEQEILIAQVNADGAELSAEAKRVVAEATAWIEAATRDRESIAATVTADLLALYARLLPRSSGAARLTDRTCEGCRMVLAGTDLQKLRLAAEDDVVFCPECGSILVRTDDSGL